MNTRRSCLRAAAAAVCVCGLAAAAFAASLPALAVSANRRFLQQADGTPFFWLGDTAWLLLTRLDRAEALAYLDDRRAKGFNVIQVMVLHTPEARLKNGALALVDGDPGRPHLTPGRDAADPSAYDYWDHLDWVVKEAETRGLYLALVPAWGSLAKAGRLTASSAPAYGAFLARRYCDAPNVVWLVGGDIAGDTHAGVWRALGTALREGAPRHLITFHPFGRTQSSTWFHDEPWLDFNMFQSGHQRYDQDVASPRRFGEDNWRYARDDYARQPPKPTLDGEPSYENIPQGLHDGTQPYWSDADARRYAYWSVFAGSCGHTYGNNAIMQFHAADVPKGAYFPRNTWREALDDPGAGQMRHLKALVLSRPYFDRVYDDTSVADGAGERYERVIAARGRDYLFVYSYTGRSFTLRPGAISGTAFRAWWFNPRDGNAQPLGVVGPDVLQFDPPGNPGAGNDWVLVLDDAARAYGAPGVAGR